MEKLPTAKDFLKNKLTYCEYKDVVYKEMIEFAKLHVEAALKAAAENADTRLIIYTDDEEIDKSSILNAYPLTNIK